ncbi:MAG: radical SAM protein [Desulfobacterales bacterium]|nr:radical SAM protein [Desulfobacterales bacterium]
MAVSPLRESVIPLFIPHAGCPHQCLFCNQKAITGERTPHFPSQESLRAEIVQWLSWLKGRGRVEISFYGGTFLGLGEEKILSCLELAESFVKNGAVHGIRFSTRPDTITPHTLDLIAPFSVTTLELGAQSMVDEVLKRSVRGHTAQDTQRAMARLEGLSMRTVLQMMAGLPGETPFLWKESVEAMLALKPYGIRIYPTVVLEKSPLYHLWRAGEYTPLSLDEAIQRAAFAFKKACERGISVIRMGLQESDELRGGAIAAGPHHPAFGHLVHSALFLAEARALCQDVGCQGKQGVFEVHPRSESEFRGMKNINISTLKAEFGFSDVKVVGRSEMPKGTLRFCGITPLK